MGHIYRKDKPTLLENGTSIPGRNGIRHRFLNRYCEVKTKSLDLRHRVKEPVPKASFKYQVKVPPGTKSIFG
jgi:hypothetical protein